MNADRSRRMYFTPADMMDNYTMEKTLVWIEKWRPGRKTARIMPYIQPPSNLDVYIFSHEWHAFQLNIYYSSAITAVKRYTVFNKDVPVMSTSITICIMLLSRDACIS